jgi:hypothetical protein
MSLGSIPINASADVPTSIRYRGPIWTLLILAPIISEVLSGSTRLSILFVLIPEIMVWGGGALLCREFIRRWRAGATSLLLLGLALSIAEEFIIQQTSIAPLPFPGASGDYARLWGVNWIYFLFMLGFESVWVVLIPVQVTELIFPDRREKPWLGNRGLIATCGAFLVGCRIAWYGWTQQARPRLHAAPYHPPSSAILTGIAAIAILIYMAWLFREYGHLSQIKSRLPAKPWLIALKTLIFGAAWFGLIGLVFVPQPSLPVWAPMTAGVAWAILSFTVVRYWSAAYGWRDVHRWGISFGAVVGCMVLGDSSLVGWSRIDLIAKFAFQVAAIAGLLLLRRKVWQREAAAHIGCR